MGSSSSKPARKLGQQASSQSLKQGTPSRPTPIPNATNDSSRFRDNVSPSPGLGSTSGFSETKTQAVQSDGQDPQLLAMLKKIGQVQVPRGKVRYQKSNTMLNILAARGKNTELEEGANTLTQLSSGGVNNAGAIKNRLNAQSIVSMLDERKECKTRRDVEQLAVSYDVDIALLVQLARFVNSPSVEANARLRQREPVNVEDGDALPERIDAIWTEPVMSDVKEIPGRT